MGKQHSFEKEPCRECPLDFFPAPKGGDQCEYCKEYFCVEHRPMLHNCNVCKIRLCPACMGLHKGKLNENSGS